MTLTEAAFWTKRFGVIAGGALLVIVVIVLIVVSGIKQPTRPPEYLNPNFACTETATEFLEKAKIEIPSLPIDPNSEAIFELATPTGKVNELPSVVNVYKFENPTQRIYAQSNAKVLAGKLGFDKEKIIIPDTSTYVWKDEKNRRTLTVKAKNLNFVLETDASKIRSSTYNATVPSEQNAKATAQNILNLTGLKDSAEGYPTSNTNITYINLNADGSFDMAPSPSDAELIRVDFFREKPMISISTELAGADRMVKELTAVTEEEPRTVKRTVNDKRIDLFTFDTRVVLPRSKNTNISVYIGAENKDAKLPGGLSSTYRIEYTYWPISLDPCGTYPLINTRTAVNEVMEGKGSIAYLYEKDGDYVTEYKQRNVKRFRIKSNVKILYYETPEEQNFLLPIYLITGEAVFDDDTTGSFDIYYPAIDYSKIQNKVVVKEKPIQDKGDSFF